MIVDNIMLVIINLIPIIAIWIRLESRLSRLEGRYDQKESNGKSWDGRNRRQH